MNIVEQTKQMAEAGGGGWLAPDDVTALTEKNRLSIDELMLELIPLASKFSRPNLSGFKVGAVGQGVSGALYFGANFEFEECPLNQTVHAEQATVVNAAAHEETGLIRLAVSAAPCGYCRQFLFELATADRLDILLAGKSPTKLTDYLPGAFGPGDLGVAGGLLAPQNHNLDWVSSSVPTSESAQAAFKAAVAAYAPYTQALAGVGLTAQNGKTFRGAYLENAAFNPSLSPLQAALVTMELAGQSIGDVEEATIVQVQDSKIDHTAASRPVFEKVTPKLRLQEFQVRIT
jgi:cytidine deaminase